TGLLASELAADAPPVVLTAHNHYSTAIARSRRPRMRRLPGLVRRFFPRASAIVAVSQGVAADLARFTGPGGPDIATIYNPIFDERLPARAAEPSGDPWLDEAGPPVILGVGKMKPQKDFPTLLRAFTRLAAKRDLRLVILGD